MPVQPISCPASTAAPQPPKTKMNVPRNSATSFFIGLPPSRLLSDLVGSRAGRVGSPPAEDRDRKARFAAEAERLRAAGARPYIIPEGGSNALGAWGYVRCMEELGPELDEPTTIVYAAGSGGTGAGLILGKL